MASFTDELIAFNPYVPQIPVDDYVRVGMIKQQQYNEGVQKVQGYIDSVAGLDVVKPEQKEYLQQRIGQLQGEVSSIVQRDFSNQQIVNSVGNLTSKIASDPIIQNAVLSTHNYRAGLAKMKEFQDKGQSSPSNEYNFQKQVQSWLDDKDITSTFSGSYTPYTDYRKKLMDALDKQLGHPDEKLEDIPYVRENGKVRLDKDGQPSIDYAMMQKSYKGVSPERIKSIVEATMDEKDKQQMMMDGQYEYRGYDKNNMKQLTDQSYSYKLDQVNDAIKGLMIDRMGVANDPTKAKEIDDKIEALKNKAQSFQEQYKQDIQIIDKNLEGYKGKLFADNWMDKFDSGMAYAQYSLTYVKSPFFEGAERKREVDIKYQEYLMNKELEGIKIGIEKTKLGIEEQKLGIEQQKLDIERFKAGLTAGGGAGAPLRLTGADIRQPISQEELEKISVDTFNKETKDIESNLDNQKMALLAQLTDLVHVVKDDNGKNPHYEYNVAGKDPNVVTKQAEATMLKLKDLYDKDPYSVDPGVKTYFDNLSSSSIDLANRKFAITKMQAEGDKKYDLTPFYNKVSNLYVESGSGTKYNITPKEIADYNNKMQAVLKSSPGASAMGAYGISTPLVFDQETADKLLNTPAERFLAGIEKKALNQQPLTGAEQKVLDKIHEVHNKVNVPGSALLQAKSKYMDNAIRSIVAATQPVAFPAESFKPEDKGRVQSAVARLLNNIKESGKSNPNPLFDQGDAAKMIDEKNHPNTTYSLLAKGDGNFSLIMDNDNVSEKGVHIDITKEQAQDLFGGQISLDDFQNIRRALQLSKNTGRVTTDVQGNGRESAFNLNSGLVTKYGVKYHVEDPLKDGRYQIKLYLYDKAKKEWLPDQVIPFPSLVSEAQVTRALSSLTDSAIDEIVNPKKTK